MVGAGDRPQTEAVIQHLKAIEGCLIGSSIFLDVLKLIKRTV